MDAGPRTSESAGGRAGLIAAFVAGVLLVQQLPALPPLAVLTALLLPLPFLGRWRWPYAVLVLAATLTILRADLRLADRWPPSRHGEDVVLRAWIDGLPEREFGDWRFVVRPGDRDLPQRIRVSWYRSQAQLRAGQCWDFTLRLRTPHGSLNPGGLDYERWLFSNHYGATAYVREARRCADSDRHRGVGPIRQTLSDRLHAGLPQHPGLPLLSALLIGDRSGLDDDDWRVLRESGTSHLVAISGLHVALIAGVAFWLMRWAWALWPRLCLLWPAQRVAAIAAALAAAAYSAMAGFSLPTLRALLMLLVFVVASLLGRLSSSFITLGLAAVVVLLLDPFAALAPGFWLSFGAVAAILYVVSGRAAPATPYRGFLRLQAVLGLLLIPASLWYFDGASLISPIVNLLAVPLFAIVLPVLLLATGLALCWDVMLPLLGVCASALAQLMQGLAWLVDHLTWAWLPLSVNGFSVLLAAVGVLLLAAPRGLPLRVLGLLLCVPLLFPPKQSPEQGFRLTALDVGQGLAVVVRTKTHTLVYDAGPAYAGGFDAGDMVVVPYLRSRGVRRVDRLMLSHGDNDHAGGVAAIRAALPVVSELGVERPCRAGARWNWDGVQFRVLHPDVALASGSDNNRSCVLRIDAPQGSALLSGDIEREAESHLLSTMPDALAADLLLAPHHGSRTSSSEAFVNAVSPRLVIFAAGWRHHFGHPHPEVVARYRALGADMATTGVEGAVSVRFEGQGRPVQRWRRTHRRYWNAPAEP